VKVAEALDQIRRVGVAEIRGGNLKLKFPESERAALQAAIDTLRSGKAEALALLAQSLTERRLTATSNEPTAAEPLESALKNRAIELWSTAAGRLFLVADDADAVQAMERVLANRGETYTAAEVRRIIAVKDPAIVTEIHDWKRRFNGAVRDFRAGGHRK